MTIEASPPAPDPIPTSSSFHRFPLAKLFSPQKPIACYRLCQPVESVRITLRYSLETRIFSPQKHWKDRRGGVVCL